jgi:hypothetical protein
MEKEIRDTGSAGSLRARFDRLMHDLTLGRLNRSAYEPWEIDLLLDIQTCAIPARRLAPVLRRYQKSVQRQFQSGDREPMRLSEYLRRHGRQRKPKLSDSGEA